MEERILSKVLVAATGEEYYIGTTGSYETVVVNVTCDDSVEWSKYTATVYDKTALETQSIKLDSYGQFTFKIKNGHHYQLLLPAISGYDSPYYMNFTATLANRSVLYKYENNALYEQLNIEAIVVNHEVGVLNEKEVKVVDVDTNTEYTTVFAEGKAVLRIPYGTTYRLFLPDADGLLHDLNYVILTAGVPSRYLLTHYSESLLGYFGIDNEGNQYTIDDIKAMPDTSIITYVGYNDSVLAQADRGDGTQGCGVMFSVDNNTVSKQWASANIEFDTTRLPFKGNIDLALKDFASSKNTHNIITIGEELGIPTPAASYCDSQIATVGGITRKGYLLAFGVLYRMVQNKTQLDELYLALGKTAPAIHSGRWWSSCQYSAAHAVSLTNGGFYYYLKTTSSSVLVGFDL